jgi:hypothetical protein
MATVFIRLLAHDDKAAALAQSVERIRNGEASPDVHVVDQTSRLLAHPHRLPGEG